MSDSRFPSSQHSIVDRLLDHWTAWGSPTEREKCINETCMAMDCKAAADAVQGLLKRLRERADWLRREYLNGGNFEYLRAREEECRLAAELLEKAFQQGGTLEERLTTHDPDWRSRFDSDADRAAEFYEMEKSK